MAQRILVAVDGSDATAAALAYATALARREGAEVHLVHVDRRAVVGRRRLERTADRARAIVADAITQLHEEGVAVSGSVVRTSGIHLGRAIADQATARHCDVIVVGSHRRRGVRHLLGRRAREQVSRWTSLPVVIAPPPLQVALPGTLPGTDGPASDGASQERTG